MQVGIRSKEIIRWEISGKWKPSEGHPPAVFLWQVRSRWWLSSLRWCSMLTCQFCGCWQAAGVVWLRPSDTGITNTAPCSWNQWFQWSCTLSVGLSLCPNLLTGPGACSSSYSRSVSQYSRSSSWRFSQTLTFQLLSSFQKQLLPILNPFLIKVVHCLQTILAMRTLTQIGLNN